MATNSDIEWTQATWNPLTGCDKISAGCANCYAETMAKRLKGMKVEGYENGFKLTLQERMLKKPYSWRKPRRVFVNSMSDLFHKDVPEEYILEVFKVMNENPRHTFQILTKRPERLLEMDSKINWTPNIWMGVTIENRRVYDRIEYLKKTNAKTKFLSIEPLLESVEDIKLDKIDWVIVGGESGAKARPMMKEWVEEILLQCIEKSIPFFFKQWGGRNKKKAGRLLNGLLYDQYPIVHELISEEKPKRNRKGTGKINLTKSPKKPENQKSVE